VAEQDDAIEGQIDQRPGQWTRLQLMEMDAAFCPRMGRTHPEREIGGRTPRSLLRRDARRSIATFSVVGGKPSIQSRLDDLPSGYRV
jgi:hypothetical protein